MLAEVSEDRLCGMEGRGDILDLGAAAHCDARLEKSFAGALHRERCY